MYPYVAMAMVIAMFQMYASVIKVGVVLLVVFQFHASTQNVQATAPVTLENVPVTLAGKAQSAKLSL